MNSIKPYLIRSTYDWCIDNDFTPFLLVEDYSEFDIPSKDIKNGEIIFNISARAVRDLMINNDIVCFAARFNGVSKEIKIPVNTIKGIFAKEVNQGIEFARNHINISINSSSKNKNVEFNSLTYQLKNNKPNLQIIK